MSSNVHSKSDYANFSGSSLIRVLKSYVPPPIWKKANLDNLRLTENPKFEKEGAEYIQKVLEVSNIELRMYGSVAELCQNLKVFRNVPYDHLLFELDPCEPYCTTPTLYGAEDSAVYISKHDAYVHVQNIILNKFNFIKNNPLATVVVVTFLKVKEQVLIGTNEYVKCSDNYFREIEDDLMEFLKAKDQDDKYEDRKLKLIDFSFDEIFDQYKKLIPCPWNDNKFQKIRELLTIEFDRAHPRIAAPYHSYLYMSCLKLCDHLEIMFDNYENTFKPYSNRARDNFRREKPKILKVFVDGDRKFAPCEDVLKTMSIGQNIEGKWEMAGAQIWQGVSEKAKQAGYKIIHIPIIRTNHVAAYVFNRKGIPHKLAIDVFFELFYEWIFGYQLFEKLTLGGDWINIERFFEEFSWAFHTQPEFYFIDKEHIEKLHNRAQVMLCWTIDRPVRSIRNAKPGCFNVDELKRELEQLGWSVYFPDIGTCATIVYEHVVANRKARDLRTCDRFEATFQGQIALFLKKYPTFVPFIHSQNGCKRIADIDCHCRKAVQSPITSRLIAKAKKTVADALVFNVPSFPQMNFGHPLKTELEVTKEKLTIAEKKLAEYSEREKDEKSRREKMEKELEEKTKTITGFQKERNDFEEFKKNVITEKEELLRQLEDYKVRNEQVESLHSALFGNIEHMRYLMTSTIGKERQAEMMPMFVDFKTKFSESKNALIQDEEKFNKLINMSTDKSVEQFAEQEMILYKTKHSQHLCAIETNLTTLRQNVMATHGDMVPVPDAPKFPQVLEQELIIVERKHEEMNRECLMCGEEKLETDDCVKCANCPTTFHEECVAAWIGEDPECVCPTCNEKLKQ